MTHDGELTRQMNTATFRLSLLGSFELAGANGPVDLGGKKPACLLGFLASTFPATYGRERLMSLLWGSCVDALARQNLRQAIYRLRLVLGTGAIITNSEMVSLRPDIVTCDTSRFEALVRDGSREALGQAVVLYNGRLFGSCTIPEQGWHEWLGVEGQRLENMALDAMVKLSQLDLEAGRFDEALQSANRALSISSLREDAHRLVIRALLAAGRRAEALKHCEYLRSMLKTELDVEPDAVTLALEAELRSSTSAAVGSYARATAEHSRLPIPNRRSIAVLPFANMSGDPSQDYVADGIVEDITTELSRFSELFVIARNSSFQYKGKPTDVRQVGRELGVQYVLEGSVRRSGKQVRTVAQLIDAQSGHHLWADKFDNAFTDLLALQDAITQSIVGAIQPQILIGEGRRAACKGLADLDAFDCCMRGTWPSSMFPCGRTGKARSRTSR